MSTTRKGPGAGTRAYTALEVLYSLGGDARSATWADATFRKLREGGKVTWEMIVRSLLGTGMVYHRDEAFSVTDDGLAWLGVPPDAPRREAAVIVGPRYVAPIRPLSSKNKPAVRDMREGAFDYRGIPSLQGASRVEFQSSLKVGGGDVAG
ncbi:MAG: hypothetical protein ACXW2U_08820 [Telluria sp.]